MRFDRIAFENFRSHSNSNITLDRINVFRAKNGLGKSSIEMALEIVLAGRCDITDDRGAGVKGLITDGKNYANVDLYSGDQHISCTINPNGKTVAGDNPSNIRDFPDVASCLVNSRYFVGLKPAEQKSLLAGIVLPSSYEWPDKIKDLTAKAGLKFQWDLKPFSLISLAYKSAYDGRRDVNRDLKNLVIPTGDTSAAGDVEEIKTRLEQRRKEHMDLVNQKAARQRAIGEQQRRDEEATRRLEEAKRVFVQRNERAKTLKASLLKKKDYDTAKKIVANEGEAQRINQMSAVVDAEVVRLNNDLANLSKLGDHCPTCRQTITEEILAAIAKPIAEKRDAAMEKSNGLTEKYMALGNILEAKKQVAAHESAENELKVAEEAVRSAETEVQVAERAANVANETLPDPAELDPQIAEAAARVAKRTEILTQVSAANAVKAQQESVVAKRKDYEAKQEALEALVDYFGPKGIVTELLDKHVGGFVAAMNKVLSAWGYECYLNFEPYEFGVLFPYDGGKVQRPINNLSKSQKMRFAVAFQVALAITTGFKFVVVDDAEMLDTEGREGLLRSLYESELDQVIVLAVGEGEDAPEVDGMAFFTLDSDENDIVSVKRLGEAA